MISKSNHTIGILDNAIIDFCRTPKSDDGVGDNCDDNDGNGDTPAAQQCALKENTNDGSKSTSKVIAKISDISKKKLQLSFSVDRLLSNECISENKDYNRPQQTHMHANLCCNTATMPPSPSGYPDNNRKTNDDKHAYDNNNKVHQITFNNMHFDNSICNPAIVYHSAQSSTVIRPKPLRAVVANECDNSVSMTLSTLTKFNHGSQTSVHSYQLTPSLMDLFSTKINSSSSSTSSSRSMHVDVPALSNLNLSCSGMQQQQQQQHQQFHSNALLHMPLGFDTAVGITASHNHNHNNNNNNKTSNTSNSCSNGKNLIGSIAVVNISTSNSGKRKRSWSRAVFSNLQRKGLEIQFQQQKYITKPDRRKLAARLNLTDAQVKVWFQNRRMKWRHTRENLKSGQEKQMPQVDARTLLINDQQLCYSSDSSSSVCASDNEEDNEIDVTG